MKTVRLTMAQALVRFLENQYIAYDGVEHPFVEGVIMLPGHGNVVGLGQALRQEAHRLKVWQGKNEQGMAHTAVAFAKQMKRKKIIAVTSSVGPGAANMVTAAATATANNIPVLILPGDVYACRQPDPVLQQIEQTHDLSVSTNDAFRAVCRYWDRIVRPEQLMSAMISAFRTLTDPANTGAVCIAIPQDVEGEAYDYPESFFRKRVHRLARPEPEPEAIEEAAAVIRTAKKPLLILGGGVRYSEAHREFRAFAEATGIPFGETQAGKSALLYDHPLNLGGIGVTGCSAANEIAKEADVIIGVGTRYTDFTTASKWLFRDDAKFVNINVSAFQALKMDAVPVVADAKRALPVLLKALGEYCAPYTTEVEAARERWFKELSRLRGIAYGEGYVPEVNDANAASADRFAVDLDAVLTQTAVLGAINLAIDPDDVVIGSAGSLPGDMQRNVRRRQLHHAAFRIADRGAGAQEDQRLSVQQRLVRLHQQPAGRARKRYALHRAAVPRRGRRAFGQIHAGGLRHDRRGVRREGLHNPFARRAARGDRGRKEDRRPSGAVRHPRAAQVDDRGVRLVVARRRYRGLRKSEKPQGIRRPSEARQGREKVLKTYITNGSPSI